MQGVYNGAMSFFYTNTNLEHVRLAKAKLLTEQFAAHKKGFTPCLDDISRQNFSNKIQLKEILHKHCGSSAEAVQDLAYKSFKNVPHNSTGPLKAFLNDVSVRTEWLGTSSVSNTVSGVVEQTELEVKQQTVKDLLMTIKSRVAEGALTPSIEDVNIIHQIANKVFVASNTSSTPHLIDLDVFFKLHSLLTTSVVEHYTISVLGVTFFLQHYTVIHLFSGEIYNIVLQRKLETFYTEQALNVRLSVPKVLMFSLTTALVSTALFINPEFLLSLKYGAVPIDCFTYGRAIGGAVSTFTKGLFFDSSDPGTWLGKTFSKILKGFLKK